MEPSSLAADNLSSNRHFSSTARASSFWSRATSLSRLAYFSFHDSSFSCSRSFSCVLSFRTNCRESTSNFLSFSHCDFSSITCVNTRSCSFTLDNLSFNSFTSISSSFTFTEPSLLAADNLSSNRQFSSAAETSSFWSRATSLSRLACFSLQKSRFSSSLLFSRSLSSSFICSESNSILAAVSSAPVIPSPSTLAVSACFSACTLSNSVCSSDK